MMVRILEVAHGTPAWHDTVRLRHAVLRAPLGLDFAADELAREASQLHLALHADGALAGVVVLVPPDRAAPAWKLRQMAVAPERRGRGFGTALVAAAEEMVRARGGHHVRLDARAEAIPFYTRLGYVAEGAVFVAVTIAHRRMSKRF